VRDDPGHRVAHGAVDLETGLVVSCNAYFAQLGAATGLEALQETAALLDISLGTPPAPARAGAHLREASYGQGTVLATPLQMARLAAAYAADGEWVAGNGVLEPEAARRDRRRTLLPPELATLVARCMRDVVRSPRGTAHRALNGISVPIAGKTGTAEVQDAPPHSWFVGFAPYGAHRRLVAFAVLIENAGPGAGAAAPLAGDIVEAAARLDMIDSGSRRGRRP
jgi:cell division protein FtsI/penicillin-binding protein 2